MGILLKIMAWILRVYAWLTLPVNRYLERKFGKTWVADFFNSIWSDVLVFAFTLPLAYASGIGLWGLCSIGMMLIGMTLSSTWVSRARQTKNLPFHKIMSVFSHGFFIFVVTAYAAMYKNTPMKFFYVAMNLIGASLGHRSAIWFEKQKIFARDVVVTRAELESILNLRLAEVNQKIVRVYARTLRKIHEQLQWIKLNMVTKAELENRVAAIERKMNEIVQPEPQTVDSQFEERTLVVRQFDPRHQAPKFGRPIAKPRIRRIIPNAGQGRLMFG